MYLYICARLDVCVLHACMCVRKCRCAITSEYICMFACSVLMNYLKHLLQSMSVVVHVYMLMHVYVSKHVYMLMHEYVSKHVYMSPSHIFRSEFATAMYIC